MQIYIKIILTKESVIVANRLFQTVIHQMKSAMLGREAGVIDESATVIACTDVNEIGAVRELAASRAKEIGDAIVVDGVTYRRIGVRNRSEYVVFCGGNDDFAKMLGIVRNNLQVFSY